LASKISAFEEVVPEIIEGGFFTNFFFLGLIVSTLAIFLSVPLLSRPTVRSAALGMMVDGIDATVSVSTVMFLADASLFVRTFDGISDV